MERRTRNNRQIAIDWIRAASAPDAKRVVAKIGVHRCDGRGDMGTEWLRRRNSLGAAAPERLPLPPSLAPADVGTGGLALRHCRWSSHAEWVGRELEECCPGMQRLRMKADERAECGASRGNECRWVAVATAGVGGWPRGLGWKRKSLSPKLL